MGLPPVMQIVSEHMGRIGVGSGAEKDTTFRLFFPVSWTGKTAGEGT